VACCCHRGVPAIDSRGGVAGSRGYRETEGDGITRYEGNAWEGSKCQRKVGSTSAPADITKSAKKGGRNLMNVECELEIWRAQAARMCSAGNGAAGTAREWSRASPCTAARRRAALMSGEWGHGIHSALSCKIRTVLMIRRAQGLVQHHLVSSGRRMTYTAYSSRNTGSLKG
jgi:hypothetical protein